MQHQCGWEFLAKTILLKRAPHQPAEDADARRI